MTIIENIEEREYLKVLGEIFERINLADIDMKLYKKVEDMIYEDCPYCDYGFDAGQEICKGCRGDRKVFRISLI